jgi:hypothetical protein
MNTVFAVVIRNLQLGYAHPVTIAIAVLSVVAWALIAAELRRVTRPDAASAHGEDAPRSGRPSPLTDRRASASGQPHGVTLDNHSDHVMEPRGPAPRTVGRNA